MAENRSPVSSEVVERSKRPAPFWEESSPLVLIADPDPEAAGELLDFCRRRGARVQFEDTGAGSLIAYGRVRPDVVVLSDELQDVPWRTVAKAMAASGGTSPVVLVLGAFSAPRPEDLELSVEFVSNYARAAQSRALSGLVGLERLASPRDAEIVYGTLVMRPAAFDVRDEGQSVPLTLREFELLRVLMLAEGRVVTLQQLVSDVWGVGEKVRPDTLKVHMNRIAHKLRGSVRLVSVRGIGYRLTTL